MPLGARVDTALRSGFALVAVPAAIALLGTLAMAIALGGATPTRVHRVYLAFARFCLWVSATRLQVHGADRIRPDQVYVVVSNHESNWDPMCILAGLSDLCLRFVVKRQLIHIPIFGQALRFTGSIVVHRTGSGEDVERIREGMSHRPDEVSLLFFAEGTRSRDGALHPFKSGAFATALAYGIPILPVALSGTAWVMAADTLRLRRGDVVLEVGEPIATDAIPWDDRAALRDRAHAAVADLRARGRRRLGQEGSDPGGVA